MTTPTLTVPLAQVRRELATLARDLSMPITRCNRIEAFAMLTARFELLVERLAAEQEPD